MMLSRPAAVVFLFAAFSFISPSPSAASDAVECPSVCLCVKEMNFVKCADEDLQQIPGPMPHGTKHLSLPGNQLQMLNPGMFARTQTEQSLEVLTLMDNQINRIEANTFSRMNSLQELYLLNNSLTTLGQGVFNGLGSLRILDISRNQLTDIRAGAFNELAKLTKLHLWGNQLMRISSTGFTGLHSLISLSLGDNLFEEIPTQSFAPLSSLEELEMLNLPVKSLPQNAFEPLTNLQKLHISNWSSLKSIDNSTFHGLTNLVYLSMQSCELTAVPQNALIELTALRQLNLGNNPLRLYSGDFEKLSHLEELYLSNIHTHFLHESPFQFMKSLKILDLSNNEIEVVPNHLFLQLKSLENLNISNNHLSTLTYESLEPLNQNLNTLDLSANPIICDCHLKWLRRHQELRIRTGFELDGVCTNPDSYNNIQIVAIPQHLFNCVKPKFDDEAEDVVSHLDKEILIECKPHIGNPQPEIGWEIDFDLPENQNKHMLENGSLHIKNVEEHDFHEYICVATNTMGFEKHSIFLVDHYTPGGHHGSGSTSHFAAVVMCITAVGISLIAGLICYKRKTHQAVRRSLTANIDDDDKRGYSNF